MFARASLLTVGWIAISAAGLLADAAAPPLQLHPQNPHYFLFRGKPAVLVTSGEHYGAVLNGQFAYGPYLEELQSCGLNLTRTFSGTYREIPGSFKIVDNTLAPTPEQFVCPWVRSAEEGAGDGGRRFDLDRWNDAYFTRLKDFVRQAGRRGIVVELVLFCTVYDDQLWNVNPMNATNNLQGAGRVSRKEVYALREPRLTAVQEALVRKIAAELNEFDNLYYEICNEPYFGGVTREWNDRMAAVLVEAESKLGRRHLIAQNISNNWAKVTDPNPHVSIFNFHYASPPKTVDVNYGLNRVIADDETGFKGKDDLWYRREGWEFLLAGGGAYSSLDYSFSVKHPDGTFPVTTSPGGGGRTLRRQLAILKRFVESFDFVRMKPAQGLLTGENPRARVLADQGRAYAVYVQGKSPARLGLQLPAGAYSARWVNTKTGKVDRQDRFRHAGGVRALESPPFDEDVALDLRADPAGP